MSSRYKYKEKLKKKLPGKETLSKIFCCEQICWGSCWYNDIRSFAHTRVSEAWLPNALCLSGLQAATEAFSALRAGDGSPLPHTPRSTKGWVLCYTITQKFSHGRHKLGLFYFSLSIQLFHKPRKKLLNLRDKLHLCFSLAERGQWVLNILSEHNQQDKTA